MTERDMPEDWKMLTAEALIQRCVLHIQRIAELQRDKAILSELLGSAQGEIKRQQARIAELEAAQQWQPVTDEFGEEFGNYSIAWDGKYLTVGCDHGTDRFLYDIELPDDVRLCRKVKPTE